MTSNHFNISPTIEHTVCVMSFKGKVVLVTGGSAGIGAATAVHFAKEGATVVIVGRNEANLNKVGKECETYGVKVFIIKADVTIDAELDDIVNKTIAKFGKLDVLVNNAGVVKKGSLKEGLLDVFDEVLNTNLRAAVRLTSHATPYLIQTKGNVVNLSSILGQTLAGTASLMAYCTSKAGLEHFSRVAAFELGPSGVRVNVVSPGPVRTDMLAGSGLAASMERYNDMSVLGRISEPEEIAEMIVYLASEKAKAITGTNITVDNGSLLKI